MYKCARWATTALIFLLLQACKGDNMCVASSKQQQKPLAKTEDPPPTDAVVPMPFLGDAWGEQPFLGKLLGGMQRGGDDVKDGYIGIRGDEKVRTEAEGDRPPQDAVADLDAAQAPAVRQAFTEALDAGDLGKLLLKLHAMSKKSGAANYQGLLAHLKEGEAKMVLLFEKLQQALAQIVPQQGLGPQLTDLVEELHEKGQDTSDNAH